MKCTSKQQGVTLLETMLVLAIAASFILLGVRIYTQVRTEAEIEALKANLNIIFQGMGYYYQANCMAGTLSPNNATAPANPFPIDITADLQTPGYINVPLKGVSFVASYALQFKQYLYGYVGTPTPGVLGALPNRPIAYPPGAGPMPNVPSVTGFVNNWYGQVIYWRPQILVTLQPSANAGVFSNILGAQSVSGQVLTFERISSAASNSGGSASDLWPSMPTVLQMNQMYTTHSITSVINGNYTLTTQYFYCGG